MPEQQSVHPFTDEEIEIERRGVTEDLYDHGTPPENCNQCFTVSCFLATIDQLKAEIARKDKALKFYGNKQHYYLEHAELMIDGGQRARTALAPASTDSKA